VATIPTTSPPLGSKFFAYDNAEEISLKNSEVFVISLISDAYGLSFRDKLGVQGLEIQRFRG